MDDRNERENTRREKVEDGTEMGVLPFVANCTRSAQVSYTKKRRGAEVEPAISRKMVDGHNGTRS